uniref:Uncharacterized protein n=1 Tax=Arundo donax TaxID=35708 RepID=A0A0A8YW52_ARUDO
MRWAGRRELASEPSGVKSGASSNGDSGINKACILGARMM